MKQGSVSGNTRQEPHSTDPAREHGLRLWEIRRCCCQIPERCNPPSECLNGWTDRLKKAVCTECAKDLISGT